MSISVVNREMHYDRGLMKKLSLLRRKAEEKQKRRERDARLALQQKDKKMRIAERVRRLPDEVLQAAQELEEIEEEEETQGLKKGKHTRMADDDENPRKRSKKKGTAGEYEVGGFRVVARNIAPKPPAADPAVLEFRNRQLFGGRVKRADGMFSDFPDFLSYPKSHTLIKP